MRYLYMFLVLLLCCAPSCKHNIFEPDYTCKVMVENPRPSAVNILYDGSSVYSGLIPGDWFVLPDRPTDGTRHRLTFSYADPSVYTKNVDFVPHMGSTYSAHDISVNCIVTSSGGVKN